MPSSPIISSTQPSPGNVRTQAAQLAGWGRDVAKLSYTDLQSRLQQIFQIISGAFGNAQDQLDQIVLTLRGSQQAIVNASGSAVGYSDPNNVIQLTESVNITGNATISGNESLTGTITTYDGIATSALGIPFCVGYAAVTPVSSTTTNNNLYGPGGNAPAGTYAALSYMVAVTAVGGTGGYSTFIGFTDDEPALNSVNLMAINTGYVAGNQQFGVSLFHHNGGALIYYNTLKTSSPTGTVNLYHALFRIA